MEKRAEEPRAFERGFRLLALSDDERTFPSFEQCYEHGVSLGELQRGSWPKFTGVDLAGAARRGNAIFTIAVDPSTKRRVPVDLRHGAWRSNETAAQIAEVNQLYSPVVIMVENNGYQQAIIDWCQANKGVAGISDFWMKLEATTTGRNKMDPRLGLPGLQVEFANKAWIVPRNAYETHPVTCPCSWCVWDREVRNHPLAPSSDLVMAMWFARQGVENYGYAAHGVSIGDLTAR